MLFVTAFLLGGVLCAVFEVVSQATGAKPPVLLAGGIGIGALCGALGIAGALSETAGAGYAVMVVGFGTAVYDAAMQALSGNWLASLVLCGVVVALVAIGVICGAVHKGAKAQ